MTDLGKNSKYHTGAADDTVSAQYALEQALAELGNLPEGFQVEVEVLPTDEADFQSRLTRLRTEIMSGLWPDIYVLSTDDYLPFDSQERLFPDANKAMLDGYFLQLDDYIENAQYMKLEEMNSVVMDAGCTPEGRFMLPMRYTFSFSRINESVTDSGGSWNEVIFGNEEIMAVSYAKASLHYFHSIFRDTVDHKTKTLTFSEEELYESVAAALDIDGILEEKTVVGSFANIFLVSGEDSEVWTSESKEFAAFVPLRNTEGGVSAGVTSFIAISKDTPYPEEAFHVVDVMMSKQFQKGEPFWEIYGTPAPIAVFSASTGVPVYDDLYQESQPVNCERYIGEEMFPLYCELRDKITDARIITNVDKVIDDLCLQAWVDELKPGDELKKLVSQAYDKMTLMAGEM